MPRREVYPMLEPSNYVIESDDQGRVHLYSDDGSEEVLTVPTEPVIELPNDNAH